MLYAQTYREISQYFSSIFKMKLEFVIGALIDVVYMYVCMCVIKVDKTKTRKLPKKEFDASIVSK